MELARLLDERLISDAASPLVTHYDDASGERVELSAATFANWSAKTCGLLASRGITAGTPVGLWLPVHWLSLGMLAACWRLGAQPVFAEDHAEVVLCTPDRYDSALDTTDTVFGVALGSLRMALPEVPIGIEDYAVEVPVFGDTWLGPYPPATQAPFDETYARQRVLLADPDWDRTQVALASALQSHGSLVVVRNADTAALERKAAAERAVQL